MTLSPPIEIPPLVGKAVRLGDGGLGIASNTGGDPIKVFRRQLRLKIKPGDEVTIPRRKGENGFPELVLKDLKILSRP